MTFQEPVCISLDEIIESYERGLLDQLRGFGVEGELFETWVPDPDPTKSILNLVESAVAAGISAQLSIRVSEAIIDNVCLQTLSDELKGLAQMRVEALNDYSIIHFDNFKELTSVGGDPTRVRSGKMSGSTVEKETLAAAVSRNSPADAGRSDQKNSLYNLQQNGPFDHEGMLQQSSKNDRIVIEEQGCVLEVEIDRESHIVEKAMFRGNWERDVAALLNLLCELIEGRPIQDMSDHAVGRLEHQVRAGRARPVPGIVLPSAVDPRFVLIQEFVRKALAKYRHLAGFHETENMFDEGAGKWWEALKENERLERIDQVIKTEVGNLGFNSDEVELARLEYKVRVAIRLSGKMASPSTDKQLIMMQLEQVLVEQLDPRLELFLEPLQDQSILRRLGGDE